MAECLSYTRLCRTGDVKAATRCHLQKDGVAAGERGAREATQVALYAGCCHKLHSTGLGFGARLGQRLVACLHPEVVEQHVGAALGLCWRSQQGLQRNYS